MEAGEERMMWSAVPGAGKGDLYPIKWEGCARGCLRFLDEGEGGEQEQEEAADEGRMDWGQGKKIGRTVGFAEEEEGDDEDGFDVDALEGGTAF